MSLDLSNNGLGDEGSTYIADALAINTSVLNIDLACNRISEAGARASAKLASQTTASPGTMWPIAAGGLRRSRFRLLRCARAGGSDRVECDAHATRAQVQHVRLRRREGAAGGRAALRRTRAACVSRRIFHLVATEHSMFVVACCNSSQQQTCCALLQHADAAKQCQLGLAQVVRALARSYVRDRARAHVQQWSTVCSSATVPKRSAQECSAASHSTAGARKQPRYHASRLGGHDCARLQLRRLRLECAGMPETFHNDTAHDAAHRAHGLLRSTCRQ